MNWAFACTLILCSESSAMRVLNTIGEFTASETMLTRLTKVAVCRTRDLRDHALLRGEVARRLPHHDRDRDVARAAGQLADADVGGDADAQCAGFAEDAGIRRQHAGQPAHAGRAALHDAQQERGALGAE